jgi:hypothetical protein
LLWLCAQTKPSKAVSENVQARCGIEGNRRPSIPRGILGLRLPQKSSGVISIQALGRFESHFTKRPTYAVHRRSLRRKFIDLLPLRAQRRKTAATAFRRYTRFESKSEAKTSRMKPVGLFVSQYGLAFNNLTIEEKFNTARRGNCGSSGR